MTLRALIADDEPLARERLRVLLADEPDVLIAAECRNGREVVATLRQSKFDVLFLDIQMPGADGFEIIRQVGANDTPLTVFVTAHNEFAIQAFEVNALAYLTKPVERPRLQRTLSRVKEKIATRTAMTDQNQWTTVLSGLEQLLGSRTDYPKRLLVPNGNKELFLSVDDIVWIEAADYYACLHVGTKSYMIRETIKDLAQTLDPDKFVRIHRSVIVNVSHIAEIFREGRSEGAVALTTGQRVRMSKAGWQSLLAMNYK